MQSSLGNGTFLLVVLISTVCFIHALPTVKPDLSSTVVTPEASTTSLPIAPDSDEDDIDLFLEVPVEIDDEDFPSENEDSTHIENHRQKRQTWAHQYAMQLAQNKPVLLDGQYNDRQNWNAAIGAPVWKSEDGKHTVGAGGTYGKTAQDLYGSPLKTQNWNAGLGYGWNSDNGKHSVGAAASYGHSLGNYLDHSFKSPPQWGVGASYRFRW